METLAVTVKHVAGRINISLETAVFAEDTYIYVYRPLLLLDLNWPALFSEMRIELSTARIPTNISTHLQIYCRIFNILSMIIFDIPLKVVDKTLSVFLTNLTLRESDPSDGSFCLRHETSIRMLNNICYEACQFPFVSPPLTLFFIITVSSYLSHFPPLYCTSVYSIPNLVLFPLILNQINVAI